MAVSLSILVAWVQLWNELLKLVQKRATQWGQASREAVRGCIEGMLGAEGASKRLTNRTNSGWPWELAAGSAAQRAPVTDILSPAGHGLRSQPAAQHTQTAFAWER